MDKNGMSRRRERLIVWLQQVCGVGKVRAGQLLDEFRIDTMQQLLNMDRTRLYTFLEDHNLQGTLPKVTRALEATYTRNEFLEPKKDFWDFYDKDLDTVMPQDRTSKQKIIKVLQEREKKWKQVSEQYFEQNLTLLNLLQDEWEKHGDKAGGVGARFGAQSEQHATGEERATRNGWGSSIANPYLAGV